jgi:toxin ParE1/3/4
MAERKPPVVWSPEALTDIDQLWNYYSSVAGRGAADRILREIAKVVGVIDDFPSAGDHATISAPYPQMFTSYFTV